MSFLFIKGAYGTLFNVGNDRDLTVNKTLQPGDIRERVYVYLDRDVHRLPELRRTCKDWAAYGWKLCSNVERCLSRL